MREFIMMPMHAIMIYSPSALFRPVPSTYPSHTDTIVSTPGLLYLYIHIIYAYMYNNKTFQRGKVNRVINIFVIFIYCIGVKPRYNILVVWLVCILPAILRFESIVGVVSV